MSAPESIVSELQKLAPSAVIELYELDLTPLGGDLIRFHSGVNGSGTDVVWKGNTYVRYPVEVSGFEMSGQGQLPRPKLIVSNAFSAITVLLLAYKDLVGVKVTRKRTLAKYLDAVNFPGGNPTADPTAEYPDDVFFVDRKVREDFEVVELELSSALDLSGVMLPRRQIVQNVCPWKYRGSECGYTGTNYFRSDDTPTSNVSEDSCGKRVDSCRARFGNNWLPYGGFPGAGLFR